MLDGPGRSDPGLRRAAFTGEALPPELTTYLTKVAEHAYKVTDSDVAALEDAGYTEDQIFEITVAAAVGAGYRRFDSARKAMS